ncbi:MAG: outer membrane lipoprotein carrier protein LolA [Acidobacteria bacterium]|nr:outer membrane lipoprotein carrier protein LolA [Acidobacteriota bacterium]
MRRFATLGLALAILVAAVAVSSPIKVDAQSAGLVSALINRMERNRRELKSLRAGISMEKYDARIHDKDNRSGVVLYVPGQGRSAYVRVDWQYPAKETLAVADGQYTLFRPRLNMAYRGAAGSSRAKAGGVFDFLNMSGQQIRTRFEPLQDIYEETLGGGVRTTHIRLVPKGGASYKYAEVWIDGGGMPVQTKVVEKNDDATTVRLTDMQKNAGIPLDQFKLQLDGSVKIVKG